MYIVVGLCRIRHGVNTAVIQSLQKGDLLPVYGRIYSVYGRFCQHKRLSNGRLRAL
jgi:hypothetical protein